MFIGWRGRYVHEVRMIKGMVTDEVDSRLLKRRDLQRLSRRRRRRLGRRDGLWDVSIYLFMLMAVSALS